MRILVLAALAFVASGCTIHVVEQPATPMLIAEAPRPTPMRVARPRRVEVIEHGSAAAEPRTPAPRSMDRPEPIRTAPPRQPEPLRTPYRTLGPEARSTQPAANKTTLHYRRLKVKRGAEPVTRVSSTSVTKAE